MRLSLLLLVLALAPARAGAALDRDLPLRAPGVAGASAGPAWRGDLVELRLSPAAARAANGGVTGRARSPVLGVAALDRVAARLGGVAFEPLFPAETAPPPGSAEPDFTSFYVAHLPAGAALAEALERFAALPEVLAAHPIAILPVDAIPNDSLWSVSTWFFQPANRRDVHAPEAWDVTFGDTAVVVAILDTGVLAHHPDLGGVVAGLPGQIWTNRVEAAGVPGVDDDGNGYVDDVHGWDFVTAAPDGLPGEDADVEDADPSDFVGHGTAVAGLVGALTDNGIGVAGLARRVRLMPLRMGWASGFSPGGEVQMNFAARAIRYATRMGASVINCSWASANTDGIAAAVTAAVAAGITVVSAAGNSNPFRYLAERDDVLSVAAVDSNDVVAAFSNRGPFVDLSAPGVAIRSTWSAQYAPAYSNPLNGTSFSAPLVAGAAALLQARERPPLAARPLTPRGVQLRLMETADAIAAENPSLAGEFGAGRLNAFRALTETSGSRATRMRARSVGAPVLYAGGGVLRVATLTNNRRLIELDPATGDTLSNVGTVGLPVGSLAAAHLGEGIGTGFFYATFGDGVFGVGAGGVPLPGDWPQNAGVLMSDPAIGDLDGDGTLEVVCVGLDGQVWAWHADGSPVDGYPVSVGTSAGAPAALSDLDGVPGVEVVVVGDSRVHVFGAGGALLPGWPVALASGARAPVVGQIGSYPTPTVVVVANSQLYAFAPDGSARNGFPVVLSGAPGQDPALADLDGDGRDDIVLAMSGPARIEVRGNQGQSLTALNWPRPLTAPALSPPVLGELSAGSPGPEILLLRGGALLGLERDGDSLATFPKPGGAGSQPTLGQADADAALEVVAGTGTDSLFYIYDAGAGSRADGSHPWPTARANFARTGSRTYAPPVVSVTPGRVADLRVTARTDSSVSLAWTATGDDGAVGRPDRYAVRAATSPLDEAGFTQAPFGWVKAATTDAGGTETLVFPGFAPATRYWFAVKAVDRAGNVSPLSNVVEVRTEVGGPLTGRPGIAIEVRERPARGTAELYWQGSPDGEGTRQLIRLFDATGRQVRVLDVGPAPGGRQTWDGRDAEGRSVPAGLYFARLLSGSLHTQTRFVLLP